ncbi:MAG: hypothetical protein COA43_00015 [Robiginitomaculum sp.]|nr:MAG: hypothetical protein COA43_00015 [Robiginitomaculum sp.]
MDTQEPQFLEAFNSFVCLGDSISVDVGEYTITARISHDDIAERPDQRQDGFWPSLYPQDVGFIGAGNGWRDRFDKEQALSQSIMDAWLNDEWYYCGIILSVCIGETSLTDHAASLWGIEANFPKSDNSYLLEVANDLLDDALKQAKTERARLCKLVCESVA